MGRKTRHIFPHKLLGKSLAVKTSQCKYATVSFEGVQSHFSWLVSVSAYMYLYM